MRIQEFDYAQTMDVLPSILWQYENATNLVGLIRAKQAWLDLNHTAFWVTFQNDIFDLTTDNPTLFSVSLWSIILNIPLYVPLNPESPDKPIWGFNQFDPTPPDLLNTYLNFEHGNFSTKGTFFILTVQEQQFLLRLRYFQLCNLGDIFDINEFLNYLCETSDIGYTGTIYVIDNLDMTIEYVFTASDFPPNLMSVLTDLDILPRPAGVSIIPV